MGRWAWLGDRRDLPWLGRYLWQVAHLNYHYEVWARAAPHIRAARRRAETTVQQVLDAVAPTHGNERLEEPDLVAASQTLARLRADSVGLTYTSSQMREMHRAVMSAVANIAALRTESGSGVADTGGLFAADRELAAWFAQQLDDDLEYVNASERRANQVVEQVHQLLAQHRQQRDERLQREQAAMQEQREWFQARQERVNLALTGAIGAILMVLAAIQSFQYTVPVPPVVKPAVIAMLGALRCWRRWWSCG